MTRLILMTGPPGIGKTSVAHALADRLEGTVACLSGDVFLLSVSPFESSEDRRNFLRRNLVSFARNCIEHEYPWVILECVIPSDEFLEALRGEIGLPGECCHAFSLVAHKDAYQRRLESQLSVRDVRESHFVVCQEWLERIRSLECPVTVDTSSRTIEEIVDTILPQFQVH